MIEIQQEACKHFECAKLSVHFMYSFALAKKVSDAEFDPVDAIDLVDNYQLGLSPGTPLQRRGIKQHLDLRDEIAFKNLKSFRAKIVPAMDRNRKTIEKQICEVQIEPLLRVFRTGAICNYKVSLLYRQAPIPLSLIHSLLGLVQQIEDVPTATLLRLPGRSMPVSLHSLILQSIRGFTKESKAGMSEIVWLDEAKGYLSGLKDGDSGESQSPWVVTSAEVLGETAAAFCESWAKYQHAATEKVFQVSQFEAEVAGILFRSVHGSNFVLEPGYVDNRASGGSFALQNLNLDARLHVTVCNRSILCIYPYLQHKSTQKNTYPQDYFVPDLLDLCEVLRARWHMLIVMNLCLDKVLSELKEERLSAEHKMRIVVNARTWLARLLEDPELYRVAGDALADISLRLKHIFREDALRKLLLEKAQLIERIRSGIAELAWLAMRGSYRQELKT